MVGFYGIDIRLLTLSLLHILEYYYDCLYYSNIVFIVQVDERLKDYENAFDIVVVDDHSIETVDLLLMKLFHCK
jgi:hypothetical protein